LAPAGLPQLVPAVTELVISELLWLNYAAPDKPVYVYINSTGEPGTNNNRGQASCRHAVARAAAVAVVCRGGGCGLSWG
jgi:ATP-dependent protease ClpP protease subunit